MISNIKLASMLIHDANYHGKEVVFIADDPEIRKNFKEFHPGLKVTTSNGSTGRVDLVVAFTATPPQDLVWVIKDQYSRIVWIYNNGEKS